MITVLIFLILLGLLVFVHELGHFLTARFYGIKADEFGFGFPPRMVGIQFMQGEDKKKISEVESIQVETLDIKAGEDEIIRETITEKMHTVEKAVPIKKWRIIWGGRDGDDESERQDLHEAHTKGFLGGTIYSLNWLPLGGFVKIKGEDGQNHDSDSFAGKSAWIRVKVLGAGVVMNFIFAWLLISVVFTLGLPQPIDPGQRVDYPDAKIQILEVKKGTPAEAMGLQLGDEILTIVGDKITTLTQVSDMIAGSKGKNLEIKINRLGKEMVLVGVPRIEYPASEGSLGISFSETAIIAYPWYQSLYQGLIATYNITIAILHAFGKMLGGLFGMQTGQAVDVTGPVGIVYLTKQMSDLGLVYLLQFAALLSINLGIINILPIPALDGGRILFILIEKLKGSPVSQRTEGMIHQVGFILLLLLMLLITIRDFSHFQILEKIGQFFT